MRVDFLNIGVFIQKIKNITYTWMLTVSLFGILLLWILYFFTNVFVDTISLDILIILTFTILIQRMNSFIKPLLKAEKEFIIIGKSNLINSLFSPILGLFW